MSVEKLTSSVTETTLALFDAAVDAYIDRLWAEVGASQDKVILSVRFHVDVSYLVTSKVFSFSINTEDTTSTLVKAIFGDYMTGVANAIAESTYSTIASVYGTVAVTVEY